MTTRSHVIGRIVPGSSRAASWRRVFGGDSVPLQSAALHCATAPGLPGPTWFYKVDIGALEPEQLERAIAYLAERFKLSLDEVRQGVMGEEGIPVLANDVIVVADTRTVC